MRVSCVFIVLGAAALAAGYPSLSAMAEVSGNPTFSKDVAPILNENCVSCHRPGQIGPMSLMSFQEVRPWAKSIAKYVGEKTMPPWHADEGFGPFLNDRSLSEDEIATIVNWVNQGARQGNTAVLLPREGEGGWYITMNGMVVSARIHEIAWSGDAFTAKFTIPGQEVQDLKEAWTLRRAFST